MNHPLMDAVNRAWIQRYGGEPVDDIESLETRINKLAEDRDCWMANAKANQAEYLKLQSRINTPELEDFAKGVMLEAVHQQERWPSENDEGKSPADWFWLIGYLAQKAMYSAIAEDRDKMLHHAITTAAALANWHLQMLKKCDMRPGIERKVTA